MNATEHPIYGSQYKLQEDVWCRKSERKKKSIWKTHTL